MSTTTLTNLACDIEARAWAAEHGVEADEPHMQVGFGSRLEYRADDMSND
jgi:hypothetical protein